MSNPLTSPQFWFWFWLFWFIQIFTPRPVNAQQSFPAEASRRVYGGSSAAPAGLCTSSSHVGNIWLDKRATPGTQKFNVCVNDNGSIGWSASLDSASLASWAGSTSITTLGTIATGTVPQANVTNLVSDLSGKAAADHTHVALHTQNTDSGTNGTTFQVDSGNTGPKLKNESGTLSARNAADDAYASFKASQFTTDDGSTAGVIDIREGSEVASPGAGLQSIGINSTTHTVYRKNAAGTVKSIDGDVNGPASSTDGGIVAFDGTGGKTLKAAATLTIAQGGTGATSFTGSRCIQSNSSGTALEAASGACGSGGGISTGTTLAGTCSVGDVFGLTAVYTSTTYHYNPGVYYCVAADTWSQNGYSGATGSSLYFPPTGGWASYDGLTAALKSTTDPTYVRFTLSYTLKISEWAMRIGTTHSGYYVGVNIYDASCNRIGPSTTTGASTTGDNTPGVAMSMTLGPGVYYLAVWSNSGTATFAHNSSSSLYTPALLLGTSTKFFATGATDATIDGSTITWPSSCGTLTSISDRGSPIVALFN